MRFDGRLGSLSIPHDKLAPGTPPGVEPCSDRSAQDSSQNGEQGAPDAFELVVVRRSRKGDTPAIWSNPRDESAREAGDG